MPAPELPESVFEPATKPYADREYTLDKPYDNKNQTVDDVVGDRVPPGSLTADGRIPAGQKMREKVFIRSQYVKGSETVVGMVNDCTLVRVYYTNELVFETYWVRRPDPDILVEVMVEFLSSVNRIFLVCPDGSITVLPGQGAVTGTYKPDRDAGAGPQPDPAGGAAPKPVWLPPTESAFEQAFQGTTEQTPEGVFAIKRAFVFVLIPPITILGCTCTAIYRRRIRVERRRLPDGPVTATFEDIAPEVRSVTVFTIPGCQDGVIGPQPAMYRPPPELYQPTVGVTVRDDGVDFLRTEEVLYRLVEPPVARVEDCISIATYQLFRRVTKKRLPDGPSQVTVEAFDPPQFRELRFRVPGCTSEKLPAYLFTAEERARGRPPPFAQQDVSAPMRPDDAAAPAEPSAEDLLRHALELAIADPSRGGSLALLLREVDERLMLRLADVAIPVVTARGAIKGRPTSKA